MRSACDDGLRVWVPRRSVGPAHLIVRHARVLVVALMSIMCQICQSRSIIATAHEAKIVIYHLSVPKPTTSVHPQLSIYRPLPLPLPTAPKPVPFPGPRGWRSTPGDMFLNPGTGVVAEWKGVLAFEPGWLLG